MDGQNGRIRELRKSRGWSQEKLARQVGVSLATVQRWEAGKTAPSRLACKELDRLFRKARIG